MAQIRQSRPDSGLGVQVQTCSLIRVTDLGQGSGGSVEECGRIVREGCEEGAAPRPLPDLLAEARHLHIQASVNLNENGLVNGFSALLKFDSELMNYYELIGIGVVRQGREEGASPRPLPDLLAKL